MTDHETPVVADPQPTMTVRSVTIGLVASAVVGLAFPYAEFVIRGTRPANTALPFGDIFLFVAVIALLNPLLRLLARRFSLHRGELLVIFVMVLVASAVPNWGLVGQLLPILTGATYYASPENRWAELILPHVPDWIAPKDTLVCRYFYEGLPPGARLPWLDWLRPLGMWALFTAAFYSATFGLTLLLRRQWVENERLVFPLMRLPLELVDGVGEATIWPRLLKSPLTWLGFALALAPTSLIGLNHYFPTIPFLKMRNFVGIPIQRETIGLNLWLNPSVVAFNYLLNSDLAFSLWFFAIASAIQAPLWRLWGWGLGAREIYGAGAPAISNQTMGAMLLLVALSLYKARHDLRAAFSAAFVRHVPRDDREPVAPRVAVLCLVGGLLGMLLWLWAAGLPLLAGAVFLVGAFVTFTALTRATVQGGVPVSRAALIPQSFVTQALGSRFVGPSGLAALGYSFAWSADIRVIMMTFFAHALKLWSELRGRTRGVLLLAVCAVVLAGTVSTISTLTMTYHRGGLGIGGWLYGGCPLAAFNFVTQQQVDPVVPSLGRWLWMAGGAAVMWCLTLAHYRFTWWPLHPLGFAIAPTQPVQDLWFSAFWGWLAKVTLMRYGGFRAYNRGVDFFMGAILGQFIGCSLWLIVDALVGGTGNMIYVY